MHSGCQMVIHQFRPSTTLGSPTLEMWVHTVLRDTSICVPLWWQRFAILDPQGLRWEVPNDSHFLQFMICIMKVGYNDLHCSIKNKYIYFSYSKKFSNQNILEPKEEHPAISWPHYINKLPEIPHSRCQLKTYFTLPTYKHRTLL